MCMINIFKKIRGSGRLISVFLLFVEMLPSFVTSVTLDSVISG